MKLIPIALGISTAFALSACGGGGDSSTGPATAKTPTVSGVVAVGAALGGAAVNVTCSAGSGSATTNADGSYSVGISGEALPCVLTATSSDGKTVLHSVVPGAGANTGNATANVTPLTELLIAQLSGEDPAKFVAAFTPTTAVSTTSVSSAQTALISVLKSAGVDVSGAGDLIGGTISAGSHQGYDGILDTLQSTMTSAGTNLGELTATVADSTGSTTAAASTLATILAPANPDCTALKSGDHRLIKLGDGSAKLVTVDATKLTVAMNGTTYQLTKGAASCDFTLNDPGSTRVLVAKSGLASWTNGTGTTGTVSLSMPAQTMDPSIINGIYNFVVFNGPMQGAFGTHNYSNGVTTAATNCAGYGNCAVDNMTPYGHLVATADGGAKWVDDGSTGGNGYHAFGFRNAQGKVIWIATVLDAGGGVGVFAPQTALALPAVGDASAFWQSTVSNSTGLSAVSEDSDTVTAVNANAVTRTFADLHTDVVNYNDPFNGLRHRAANACTTSSGAAKSCSPSLQLPLGGMTLSLSGSGAPYGVSISVSKPGSK
ncbi:hypothetical protein [Paraburkholderia sacchari]|uniref:hypothetical protein n=1 Tax=Paraburkholderia sacchari TaxID=159450 RepID=UPI001BCF2060|nr:hypothetical protein [Paraburkholderia sacchari]